MTDYSIHLLVIISSVSTEATCLSALPNQVLPLLVESCEASFFYFGELVRRLDSHYALTPLEIPFLSISVIGVRATHCPSNSIIVVIVSETSLESILLIRSCKVCAVADLREEGRSVLTKIYNRYNHI